MSQVDSYAKTSKKTSSFDLNLPGFPALGKNALDNIIEFQTEALKLVESRNQALVARARSEADLASEYMNRFGAVHSISEATSVFQDYVDRRTKLTADDVKRLWDDNQEFLAAVGRFWSKKWPSVDAVSIGAST